MTSQHGDNVVLNEAYKTMLASFMTSLPHSGGEEKLKMVKPCDVLMVLLSMKMPPRLTQIEYEYERSADDNSFLCFVLLPGGSCFGNSDLSSSQVDARQSAAKIAFINSVFNEHPSKLISPDSIARILQAASFSFVDDPSDVRALDAFEAMLHHHMGETMLDLQSSITTFQLLHWNNAIPSLRANGCSREEVLDHYCHRKIDFHFRQRLVDDWMSRAQVGGRSLLLEEMTRARSERTVMVRSGRECRFPQEKLKILKQALKRLDEGRIQFAAQQRNSNQAN